MSENTNNNEYDIDIDVNSDDNTETITPEELSQYENDLLDEIERAKTAEQTLRTDLDVEILRAIDKETSLKNIYDTLVADVQASVTSINNEATRAIEAETLLKTDLDSEISRAKKAESDMLETISNNNTSVNTEINALKTADTEIKQDIVSIKQVNTTQNTTLETLTGNITAETTRATNKENALNSEIINIKSSLESLKSISDNLSENYAAKTDLNSKVDKKEGYSLISDSEITRLSTVKNYDDTKVKTDIEHLDETKQEKGNYALKSELPTIPTNVSAFTNDKGYLTEHQDLSEYAKIEDLSTKQNKGNYALKSEIPDISNLAKKTDIPTQISAFTNDKGYLTEHQNISNLALKSEIPTIPTNVSAFTNDKGYLTEHQDISNLALKSELSSKVDKVEGYSLISDDEIERLKNIENYDDSEILSAIETLQIEQEKEKDITADTVYTKKEINELLETKANEEIVKNALSNKVDRVSGKRLSSNDFTDALKEKLNEIEAGAQVNTVTSVNGQTGDVIIASGGGASNSYPTFCVNSGSVDNTGEANFLVQNWYFLTAKAPFVYTTAAGVTHEVNNDVTLDLSNYSYGNYNAFIERNSQGIYSLALYNNTVSIQKTAPTEPTENDVWVNTSVYPESSYKYYRQHWVFYEGVAIGSVSVIDDGPAEDEIVEEEKPTL